MILKKCRPGSVILWRDFTPGHVEVYPFIKDVLRGIERLHLEKLVKGMMLHLQDSFMGIYKVPDGT